MEKRKINNDDDDGDDDNRSTQKSDIQKGHRKEKNVKKIITFLKLKGYEFPN